MPWLLSLIVTGAVLTSGTALPGLQNQYYAVGDTGNASPVVLDETERFEKTYPFNANGVIEISNINGSIEIDSWDRNEIKFEYVKIADTTERLADMTVKIDAQSDRFKVTTDYSKMKQKDKKKWVKGAKLLAEFHLVVPKTANLRGIESVNGSVMVSSMTNNSEISAVNGTIKAMNLRGNVSLSTVNGTVYADFASLEKSSKVSVETVNGTVKLLIPSDSSATVKAETVNGRITNDFRLPVRKGKYVGNNLYGKIGNGDVPIDLNSVNGALVISRKQDGKNLSPSTNLLKSNPDDDEIDVVVLANKKVSEAARVKTLADFERATEVARVEGLKEARRAIEEATKDMRVERISSEEMKKIQQNVLKEAEKTFKELEGKSLKIDREKLMESLKMADKARLEALERTTSAMFFERSPYIEEKSETFTTKGVPSVNIDAQDCTVVVRGWDKDEVKYSVTRVQRNRANAPVIVNAENGKEVLIKVETSLPEIRSSRADQVRLEVFVPKKSNLEIHTRRELRVEGISGQIKLTSENGAVNVRDVKGKLELYATNENRNRVRILGFEGDLYTHIMNGDAYLEGDFKKITAEGNGSTYYLTLSEDSDATIKASSINIDGDVDEDSTMRIGTVDVTREKEGVWRVGNGRANYSFDVGDGEIFLRSKSSIRSR
ncbi:MAG: hypothetical protein KDB79_09590 [Acidobacteria bacterium]|nr:hypothetical protein [Acidobacteriota bacterium]